jgi:hypothetical protein
MDRSWLDKENTERKYKLFSDPSLIWLAKNEFQSVKCPHCNETQFCRLTRIWQLDSKNHQIVRGSEIHTNFNKNLDSLKKLLVAYESQSDPDSGIKEEQIDGIWKLTCKGKIIGEEIEIRE